MNLAEIAQKIQTKSKTAGFPVKLVAIDGYGGAGKSTIADKLAKELHAEVLHTDDFASWEIPYEWWPRFMHDIIEPIKAGSKTLSYVRSSWGADHHPEPIRDQPVTPIVLVEGVASARTELRPYLASTIWVDTPRDLCLQRGLERDGEDSREQWQTWVAVEDKYIAEHHPEAYADFVVKGYS